MATDPRIFGQHAGLPAWIMQYTDPSDEDFKRSFNAMLELAGGTSRDLINRNADMARTSLVPWQPYQPNAVDVVESVRPGMMGRVAGWIQGMKTPDDGVNRNTFDDLVGQARVYSVQDAESMRPEELALEVERRRAAGLVDSSINLPFSGAKLPASVMQFGSSFYGSLIDVAREIPFVGDALTSVKAVRNADRVFAAMEEFYRTEADLGKMGGLVSGAGTLAAYAGASYVAWQGIAATGFGAGAATAANASRLSKIAQMAMIGGTDAWLLAGGGDAPLEQRGMNIIAGMTLGGLMGVGPRVGGAALGAAGGGMIGAEMGDGEGMMIGAAIGATAGIGVGSIIAYQALQQRARDSFRTVEAVRDLTPPFEPNVAPGIDAPVPRSGTTSTLSYFDPNIADVMPPQVNPVRLGGDVEPRFHTQLSATPFAEEAVRLPEPPLFSPEQPPLGGTTGGQLSRVRPIPRQDYLEGDVVTARLENGEVVTSQVQQISSDYISLKNGYNVTPNEVVNVVNGAQQRIDLEPRTRGASLWEIPSQGEVVLVTRPDGSQFQSAVSLASGNGDVVLANGEVVHVSQVHRNANTALGSAGPRSYTSNEQLGPSSVKGPTPLSTPEERAQIQLQRMVSIMREEGQPIDADFLADEFQRQLKIFSRHETNLDLAARQGAAIAKENMVMQSPALVEAQQALRVDIYPHASTAPAGYEGNVVRLSINLPERQGIDPFTGEAEIIEGLYNKTTRDLELTIPDIGEGPGSLGVGTVRSYGASLIQKMDELGFPVSTISGSRTTGVAAKQFEADFLAGRRVTIPAERFLKERSVPLSQKPSFDDFDAAVAQKMTTPSQTVVVPDVKDPAAFVQRAVESGKIDPGQIRFVAGPRGVIKAVIGPEMTAAESSVLPRRGTEAHEQALARFVQKADRVAAQVEKFGVFEGQLVKDAYGNEGIVRLVSDDGVAQVSGKYSDEVRKIPVGQLLPEPHGMEEHPQGQGFYAALQKYASDRLRDEAIRSGLPRIPDWTSDEMSSQLPRYMEELFDEFGITMSERPALSQAVDKYRLGDLKNLMDNETRYYVDSFERDAAEFFDNYIESSRQAPPTLEEYAATRGFDVQYDGVSPMGGSLVHARGEPVPFSTREEAMEFLREFHAAEPSLTIGVDEVVSPPFGTSARGSNTPDVVTYETALTAADEMVRMGDRMMPPPPPPPPGGTGSRELPPEMPDEFIDVAAQIKEAAEGRTEAYMLTVAQAHSAWSRLWEPRLYGVLQQLEEDLVGRMGVAGATPFADAQNLNIKLGVANNANVEWAKRFDNAIRGVSRARVRNGDLFEVAQLPLAERAAAMTSRGYKPKEIQAVEDLRKFFDDARQHALDQGIDLGYLPNYLPHLRKFVAGQSELADLPKEIQWFAEMLRTGGVKTLETDVSVLAARYIHGMNRKIHAGAEYERVATIWSDQRIPEEIRTPVARYMQDKFFGNTQVGTMTRLIRDTMNAVAKPMGLKFSASDVSAVTSTAVRLWYTSFLGSIQTITRDMIQPLWAAGEAGPRVLQEFVKFHTGGLRYKRDAIELGMKHGWIERGRMQIEHSDVFRTSRNDPAIGDPIMTEADLARRASWSERINQVFDLLPGSHNAVEKVVYAPAEPFRVLGYANRAIPGKVGFDLANEGANLFYNGQIDRKGLLEYVKLDGARPPVQNEFLRLVSQGKTEEAAVWAGHYFADSQFRYGVAETPEVMQGDMGRLLAMTGTFSNQALRRYKDALFHGSPGSRVRFAAMHLALYGAIGAAAEASGIRGLTRLWWWPSIAFGGGPAVQFLADAAGSVGAFSQGVAGQEIGPEGQQSLRNMQYRMEDFGTGLNPYKGLIRNAVEIEKGLDSTIPLQQLGSVFFSGRTDPSQFFGNKVGPLDPSAWVNGAAPPSYIDINSLMDDRVRGQSLDRGVAVDSVPAAPSNGGGALF